MSDIHAQIPRATTKLDHDTFIRLLNLVRKRPWLESPNASPALIELWNLCDHPTQQNLIEDLLTRYAYIDSNKLIDCGRQISGYIREDWKLTAADTLLVATADDDKPDGSQALLQNIKNKFPREENWTEANFCNSIVASVKKLDKFTNIVLLDDFIGTGRTIIRRVIWYRNQVKERGKESAQIFVIALACMTIGRDALQESKVPFYTPMLLKKGISEHYPAAEVQAQIDAMLDLEGKLEPHSYGRELPSLGYGQCEALFAQEGVNVPNNVFPIFWWPEMKPRASRKTLFSRL